MFRWHGYRAGMRIVRTVLLRWLLIMMAAGLAGPPSALAARRLHFYVIQGGKTNLQTIWTSSDATPAAKVWRNLGREPAEVDEPGLAVAPEPGNPLRATLTGEVEIKLTHAIFLLGYCKVTNLILIRRDANSPRWYLPRAEVERTARAAGLKLADRGNDYALAVALLGVAIGLGVLWVLVRRAKQGDLP